VVLSNRIAARIQQRADFDWFIRMEWIQGGGECGCKVACGVEVARRFCENDLSALASFQARNMSHHEWFVVAPRIVR
jgi:hypothetical protein